MEDTIRRELDAIGAMVSTWQGKYLEWATADGNNEFLVEEFMEEVDTYVLPFVRRMTQVDQITLPEANEFLNRCYGQVADLRTSIKELEMSQTVNQ
jgi:hypothetical protein